MANQSDSLDIVFHALSDATRRRIVERLRQGPASVSALARPFAMSLPAAMQHLQVLEASGLVHSEKIGRVRTCRLELKKLSRSALDQRAPGSVGGASRSIGRLPGRVPGRHRIRGAAMTDRNAVHDSFVIERSLSSPPTKVFDAFADPKKKAKWFGAPDNGTQCWISISKSVVGSSTAGDNPAGRSTPSRRSIATSSTTERIVTTYEMTMDGAAFRVSSPRPSSWPKDPEPG